MESPIPTVARRAGFRSLLALFLPLVLFVATYVFFIGTPLGQYVDLSGFGDQPRFSPRMLHLIGDARDPLLLLAAGCAALSLIVAVVQRRFRVAVEAVCFLAAAGIVAVALKTLLPRPQLGVGGYGWNTFPSGHATGAIASCAAILLLRPVFLPRWALVPPLAALCVLNGWVQVITFAHRQADPIGAALLVATVAGGLLLVTGRRSGLGPVALGVILLGAAFGLALMISWVLPGHAVVPAEGLLGMLLLLAAVVALALIIASVGDDHPATSSRRGESER